LLLLIQGIPVQQGGTVTGVLRDAAGMPAPGIRMAAVTRPDSLENIFEGTVMAGIAETDAEGKFILENIPPGRYVIAAGRLDLQTYYPGTQTLAEATVVTISPGATISGINFVLNSASFGRAANSLLGPAAISAAIPVRVLVEGNGKLPISSGGNFVSIRAESLGANPVRMPIDSSSVNVPGPVTADYRVTMENLPDHYVVKSVTYGSTDITKGTFRLTPSNFTPTANVIFSPTAGGAVSLTETQLRTILAGVSFGLTVAVGPTPNANPTPPPMSHTPPSTLTITLAVAAPPSGAPGVRVSGRTGKTDRRLIYLSGRPGTLFSDGSFEFRGVAPGRHLIATVSNPGMARAAVVVVGDKDVDGVELKEAPVLPADVRVPTDPLPAGNYPPGTVVPFARITGRVVEEVTKAPIVEGQVAIGVGTYSHAARIDQDGRFESLHLLPGTYDLKLQIFGHTMNATTIAVEDKDVELELTSRRLY
jgi:hypothetical protein